MFYAAILKLIIENIREIQAFNCQLKKRNESHKKKYLKYTEKKYLNYYNKSMSMNNTSRKKIYWMIIFWIVIESFPFQKDSIGSPPKRDILKFTHFYKSNLDIAIGFSLIKGKPYINDIITLLGEVLHFDHWTEAPNRK